MSLEEMMKDGQLVTFQQYKEGELWYRSPAGFDYPEPATYQGNAAYFAQENALQLIR